MRSDPLWRESWYYNFSDPTNEIGAWLYLWVLPNQSVKSGMLVSLYHNVAEGVDSNNAAWTSPSSAASRRWASANRACSAWNVFRRWSRVISAARN